jgi:hypothetical protein
MMIAIGMISAVMGIVIMIGSFCGFRHRLLSDNRGMDGRENPGGGRFVIDPVT